MKKALAGLTLTGALCAMTAQAAFDGSVKINSGPYQNGSGGEFGAVSVSGSLGNFETFCLEQNEHISFGNTYDYRINTGAVQGGVGAAATDPNTGLTMDNLSVGTAWLYSQFRAGTLANYFNANRNANAGVLQNAIWGLAFQAARETYFAASAACHVFTPYNDYTTVGTLVKSTKTGLVDSLVTSPTYKSNAASGNHYTNGPNEKIDMWWMQPSKGLKYGKMDDNYQDYAGGQAITNLTGGNANGRHVDDVVVASTSTTWPVGKPTYSSDPTQGSFANTQNLKLDGTGASVAVPLYIIPGSTSNYIAMADTVSGGVAKKVTAVSSTGVLTYSGGTLDPNTGTDYQRLGNAANSAIGAKCIPSVVTTPLINGRADIDCVTIYTGTGYIVEYKRKLKTGDVLKQDIDFSSLQDQPFGFAVWDKSNYQHAIQPNLMLKFQK